MRPRFTVVTFLCLGGLAAVAGAQMSPPAFEVASVKPSGPAPFEGRPLSPGRWRASRSTLVQLIGRAYPQFRFDGLVVGGPAWIRDARFDIDARMDPATTASQLAQMIATLLADRFALRTHTEQRSVNVYVLRRSRDDGRLGPQLTRSDPSCADAVTARLPLPPPCRETATRGLQYRAMQIGDLLGLLAVLRIDRPVLDRTGLDGHFDLQLEFDDAPFAGTIGRPRGANPEGVSFFTALQEQAGLRLDAARESVEVLVVDSADMPTPD